MTYFYVLLKEWKVLLIAFLAFIIVILLLTGSRTENEKQKIENDFNSYKQSQVLLTEKAKASVTAQELLWQQKLTEVQYNANKKINEADAARRTADAVATGLSKQLNTANKRLSEATRETAIEYATTSNSVLESCITEYRVMAEKADGHAIAQMTLEESWPVNSSQAQVKE